MTEEKFAELIKGKDLTELEVQVLRKSVELPAPTLPDYLASPTTALEAAHFKAILMQVWASKMG